MSSTDPLAPEEPIEARLRTSALARFISNGSIVLTGFLSATITARSLGPAGKGTLSTMLYIVIVCSLLTSLGLGDAAIVMAAGSKERLQQIMSITVPLLVIGTLPAIAIIVGAAWMAQWSGIFLAVVAACIMVFVRALNASLIHFQNALERFVRSSLISVAQVTTELIFLVLLVIFLDLGITGGMFAALFGLLASTWLSIRALRRDGLRLKFETRSISQRPAVVTGLPLALAQVLVALAQRFDLVLVYTLLGEADAGLYAVALTLGQLASYTSNAISMATFPRLARLDVDESWRLISRISRMSLTSALLSAVVLLPTLPLLVPLLFGERFSDAVLPTMILLAGGVVWSQLTTMARAVSALEHPVVQLVTFAAFLVMMLALDLLLIDRWGIAGAAGASLIASSLALIGFLLWYRRQPMAQPLRTFWPRRSDVLELGRFVTAVMRKIPDVMKDPKAAWSR